MPRIILKSGERHPRHKKLLKALIQEFRAPEQSLQPFILEEHMPQTKSRSVYVIWDELAPLPLEERYDLIIEAYKETEGELAAAEVVNATGLTAEEALAYGLLPFRVVPQRRKGDRYSIEDYQQATAEEAERTLLGTRAGELRFVRGEDAERARQRLTAKLPGSAWSVLHDEALE